MRLLQPQFNGIFDSDDPFVTGDMARYRIQQCRLAGAGASRDQDIGAAAGDDIEEPRHVRR